MLTVRVRNVFTSPDDIGEYSVNVMVNNLPIWNGNVTHDRKKGAGELLRQIAQHLDMGRQHGSHI